jgi:hypothetical protein
MRKENKKKRKRVKPLIWAQSPFFGPLSPNRHVQPNLRSRVVLLNCGALGQSLFVMPSRVGCVAYAWGPPVRLVPLPRRAVAILSLSWPGSSRLGPIHVLGDKIDPRAPAANPWTQYLQAFAAIVVNARRRDLVCAAVVAACLHRRSGVHVLPRLLARVRGSRPWGNCDGRSNEVR